MEKVQLKNICRPKQWKTLTGKNLVPDGKYPVYGANGIIGYYNDYNHENETLMIGCRGTCGALNISQPFSYINGNAMALDDLVDDIDIRYLYYALMGRGFQDVISGAVQPQIIRADLEKMEVWIGNKKEQKEIVDVFNKLDTVLSHRKREIQYLDDLIKARFVELFGDPTENPNGYQINRLSNYIISLTSGSRGWAKYCVNDGNEWFITIKNVKDCSIITDNMQPIKAPDNAEARRTKVKEGDLLISITADLGRTGVVTKKIAEHGAYINQHLSCIRLDREVLNPLFVAHYMESPAGKEQFIAKNQSAVKAGLNFNSIKSLKLMIPPMEKQNEFEQFVHQIDKSKLLSGCRLFHSWAPENRDKPKHVGVPRRETKDLRGGRRQQ